MRCRQAKKDIPLLAGGDLSPRKARKILAHIEGCRACRLDLEGYRSSLARVKAASQEEGLRDWSEPEWKAVMARIITEKSEERSPAPRLRPRWAMASGLAAVVLLAVLTLVFRNSIFRPEGTAPAAGPEVVSVTMVSQETGLQVVWFLNKYFEWKGDNK
jgi:anti-sigma factor RsiW